VKAIALLLLLSSAVIVRAETIEKRIDGMTDEQRVAQLLFVGFSGQVENEELRRIAGQWQAGGIALYVHNIESRQQVRRLNEAIVKAAGNGVVPFIAVDQEGGIVHRLRLGVPVVPSAMAIGATGSPELARRAGFAVGAGLRELGFTMNFAPVLDVLTEPRNAAIGTRAFSDDPELTAKLGAAFVIGEQEAGVLAVGKHFPGQGGVAGDTHATLPALQATLADLRRRELIPFRRAFEAGLAAVMTSHITLPRIAPGPATLSRRVMKDLLRDELRFDGILISDALQMDALTPRRDPATIAIEAIAAGSDMVLMLGGAKQRAGLHATLVAAYRSGRLPKARVRESLRRVLAAKARLSVPQAAEAEEVVAEIARRAATIVPGSAPLIPLRSDARIAYIGPSGSLRAQFDTGVTLLSASVCVAAAANEEQFAKVRAIREEHPHLPIVFVNLGSPFRLLTGPRSATLLLYAEDDASQLAAIAVLRGGIKATGRAPVKLSQKSQGGEGAPEDRLGIAAVPLADDRRVRRTKIDS
jgi:beta-N-acetylhexosaminidase